ncbi:uncharacterized protein JCM6883_002390 [Sporobolomyces salmoneus]|uniref:uncharacterized protein n=1 Tax=Sporobolomyces salmoneus TaxID=183962 RepID=UPI003170A485
MESPYDPPLPRRGRSTSFSAPTDPSPSGFNDRTRRQSLSSVPTSAAARRPSLALSDDEVDQQTKPLIDLEENYRKSLDAASLQDPEDFEADRKLQREGRQSRAQRVEEDPGYKASGDMEQFMAQIYDLTHTIDSLDNDIDSIVSMRNKIVSLDPSVDIGQVSLQADLHALAALTTSSGKKIVSLETWLTQLHKWSKQVKQLIKEGKAGESIKEVGEIKFELANAKLDFAAAMERIREGAYKEQQKRERTRIWMARHVRSREPEIKDDDVKGLLKAAELGAADGVKESHVTSYAGLWALQNPFTELAELTNGMRFLHDELDREIVNHVTGKDQPKRIIYVNGIYSRGRPDLIRNASSATTSKKSSISSWFTRGGGTNRARGGTAGGGDDGFDNKFRTIQAQMYASGKDLEYGFARQQQLDRLAFRKKMIIALLLVIIAALILFISLATMRVPGETSVKGSISDALEDDEHSTFVWGDVSTASSPTPVVDSKVTQSESISHGHSSSASEVEHSSLQTSLSLTGTATLSTSTRNVVNLGSSSSLSVPTALSSSSSSIVWWTPEPVPSTIPAVPAAIPGGQVMAGVTMVPAGVAA